MTASSVASVFASSVVMRGGAQSLATEDAQLVNGKACRRGGVRSGGVRVSCEESTSGASKGLGGERLCEGRGRDRCRHRRSLRSTSLWLPHKR